MNGCYGLLPSFLAVSGICLWTYLGIQLLKGLHKLAIEIIRAYND